MVRFTKIMKVASIAVILCYSAVTGALAHELWVNALGQKADIFKADIGYGHNFPKAERIPDDRLHIINPLQLVTPDETIILDQMGENYAYQKNIALKKGSYLILCSYLPTFWSKGIEGWTQEDRIQRPDAIYVEEAISCAKTIYNYQNAATKGLVTTPVGQRLEIVPKKNPAAIGLKDQLPVQVVCDGRPLKETIVEAIVVDFSGKKETIIKEKTDAQGIVVIQPLRPGYWLLKTKHTYSHPDQKRADEVVIAATLTFWIGD